MKRAEAKLALQILVAGFPREAVEPETAAIWARELCALESGEAARRAALTIVRSGDNGQSTFVWRIKDGRINKVTVQLGARDERSGEYELKGGLADGDVLLRNPGSALIDGQRVEMAKPVASAASASTPK